MQHWLWMTAMAVVVAALKVGGTLWIRRFGSDKNSLLVGEAAAKLSGLTVNTTSTSRSPICGSAKDTSASTGGSTEAGIVCVKDDVGLQTRMFYWQAKVPAPQGILFYLGGGPGCSSSHYMFQLGPSQLLADGKLLPNPAALAETLNFNVFFLDAPAHVGYSWSPTPAAKFNYSDAESSKVVAAAIVHIHKEFADLPVIIAGVSYGTKSAALVASKLLTWQPNFPLHALCLDAVLLDRIAALKNWTGVFGRFLGPEAAESLRAAGVDAMEGRAEELRDAGDDQGAGNVIEEMWQTTVKLTGVKNQHYLSPKYRYSSDAYGYTAQSKTYLANLSGQLALNLPNFNGCNGAVWGGFSGSRLRDATWSLRDVFDKGVRVLLLSGVWDGMCTVEATTSWLEAHFPGRSHFLSMDSPQLTPDAVKLLASQSMVHVEVTDCGHGVVDGQPSIYSAALRAFLGTSSLHDSTGGSKRPADNRCSCKTRLFSMLLLVFLVADLIHAWEGAVT